MAGIGCQSLQLQMNFDWISDLIRLSWSFNVVMPGLAGFRHDQLAGFAIDKLLIL